MEITYTQQGDYLLPDLKLPEQPKVNIGIWGKRHLQYIEHHHKIRYTNLLTSSLLTLKLYFWIKVFKFSSGIGSSEMPRHRLLRRIASRSPSR